MESTLSDFVRGLHAQGIFCTPTLPNNNKKPYLEDWNDRQLYPHGVDAAYWDEHPKDGVGYLGGFSDLVTFDIDDLERTRELFRHAPRPFNMDLDAELERAGVRIISSKDNRAKIVYKRPPDFPFVPTFPVTPEKGKPIAFEIRSATADGQKSSMDVIRGIHPDTGNEYAYEGSFLEISYPPNALVELIKLEIGKHKNRGDAVELYGPVQEINELMSVGTVLERNSYQRQGNKWLCPNSSSKVAGVVSFNHNEVYSFHGSDVLNDGNLHDVADLIRILEHDGNWKQATKAMAEEVKGLEVPESIEIDLAPPTKNPEGAPPTAGGHIIHEAEENLQPPGIQVSPPEPTGAPPGYAGTLYDECMRKMRYPLPEAALLSILTVLGGMAGRAFDYRGVGLNNYYLLLAESGSGKNQVNDLASWMLSSIERKEQDISGTNASGTIRAINGASAFTSEKALLNILNASPTVFSIIGEAGYMFQSTMSGTDTLSKGLLGRVLDLYGESHQGGTFTGKEYAKKEDSVLLMHSPSLTLLGESTAESFYSNLDAANVESGFIPRFIILESKIKRPHFNRNSTPWDGMPDSMVDALHNLWCKCRTINASGPTFMPGIQEIAETQEASDYLYALQEEIDSYLRGGSMSGAERAVTARMFVHVLKTAGLLAVLENPEAPVVTVEMLAWVKTVLVEPAVRKIVSEAQCGRLTDMEEERVHEVLHQIELWSDPERKSRTATAKLKATGGVTEADVIKTAVQRKCFKKKAFQSEKATQAVRQTLDDLVAQHAIVRMGKTLAKERFKCGHAIYFTHDLWHKYNNALPAV